MMGSGRRVRSLQLRRAPQPLGTHIPSAAADIEVAPTSFAVVDPPDHARLCIPSELGVVRRLLPDRGETLPDHDPAALLAQQVRSYPALVARRIADEPPALVHPNDFQRQPGP